VSGPLGQHLARIVGAAVVTHVVLTAFENSPDAKVSFGNRSQALGRLPQWRFFAPTPGIENNHLAYRGRARAADRWGTWEEISLFQPLGPLALVWNPRTRAPKALFDCAQQLRVMSGSGPKWDAVTKSQPYRMLEHAVRVAARDRQWVDAQFMVMASRDGADESMFRPLLVSDPFDTRGG
jgi:hypothetical protein